MIKEYIGQPYPLVENKWRLIISIGLFVTLFMLVFQPFGLSVYQGSNRVLIITGFGLVTFFILIVDLFVIQFSLKKLFRRKSWTVMKQILWLVWIIFTIGTGNYLYSAILFSYWSWYGFLMFQVYTLSVGMMPIVVLTILKQNILLSQNLKSVKEFNAGLNRKDNVVENQMVCLMAENQKDKIEMALSDLLYIESSGNYIKVFYVKDGTLRNTLLRCTLKRAMLQMEKYSAMVKCHRAFLININKIKQVKGNSQGLRLALSHIETEIPVSRNFSKRLKDRINFQR